METEVQKQIKAAQAPNLIQRLMQEAATNPMSKAVFEGFALRIRTRAQVTVHSLTQKMQKEGFDNYASQDSVNVIKLLAQLRLGDLVLSPKGKVRAIKNIKVTLQSIGLAALGSKNALESAHFSNKFIPLQIPKPVIEKVEKSYAKTKGPKVPMEKLDKRYEAELIVHFEDEVVTFKLVKGITPQQIGSFMARYYNNKGV